MNRLVPPCLRCGRDLAEAVCDAGIAWSCMEDDYWISVYAGAWGFKVGYWLEVMKEIDRMLDDE